LRIEQFLLSARKKHTNVQERSKDTKGVIRNCNSKKNRQYNGQKKKYKRTNIDLLSTTLKAKDRANTNPTKKLGLNSCTSDVLVVPVPLLTTLLLFNDANII